MKFPKTKAPHSGYGTCDVTAAGENFKLKVQALQNMIKENGDTVGFKILAEVGQCRIYPVYNHFTWSKIPLSDYATRTELLFWFLPPPPDQAFIVLVYK